jgi:single-stranded-DNA-specific exonuclease
MADRAADVLVSKLPEALWKSAMDAAGAIRTASRVLVATHIDADGISAAAVAAEALRRAGGDPEVKFHKKLDDNAISELRLAGADLVWFTDLGSGSISKIEGIKAVVTDHHVPDTLLARERKRGQALISDFQQVLQVNPALHGIQGATELSGAGSTFLAALALDRENIDLAYLAVLGAIGDLQDQKSRRLEGINRDVLNAAIASGAVRAVQDIRYFGRETRPIHKMLEFSSDPAIPGITGNEQAAISFLIGLGLDLKERESWKTWAALGDKERESVIEAIKDVLRSAGRRPETIARLTGEVYMFPREQAGSPLRDAKEFATLLNACGRHGRADVGLAICRGDRKDILAQGIVLLRDHRSALSQALALAKGKGIVRLRHIQYFDAGDEIEDTIVGTVAGMLLNSEGSDRSAPMVAFADSTEYSEIPSVKASARGTQDLVAMGMDLSQAMRRAAESVGGVGGGHNIAAGATVPTDRKTDFLKTLDDIVGSQITGRARRAG